MSLPRPDRMKFDDLIRDIRNGHLLIPQFQRDFVWNLEDTGKLIDSILKGYPVGTFILWITRERMGSVKELGGELFPEPHKNDNVKYVLDGQQRIASLFVIHEGKSIKKDKKVVNYRDIYINLTKSMEDEEPIVSTNKEGEYITVYDLIHDNILELAKKHNKVGIERIISYREILNEYEFSTIELRDHDLNAAVEVFTRINTTGTLLTLFEIMVAKTYEDKKFDMKKKYDEFRKKLDKKGYGTVRPRSVLNVLSLILKGECTRKAILNLDKTDVINTWADTIKSVELAIDYFKTQLRINASEIIPYDSLITLFAYFYFKNNFKNPDIAQRENLNKYFWKASLAYRFTSGASAKIGNDSKKMYSIVMNKTPKYDFKPNLDKEKIKYMKFSTGNSYCKAILCLLAQQEPLSFKDGSKILLDNSSLRRSNSRNYHHFFPKNFLKRKGLSHINSIINITYVNQGLNIKDIKDKPPSIYIKKFSRTNSDLNNTMKTHLIDDIKDFGIWDDDYARFLEKRTNRIFAELKKKMT